MPTPGGLGRIAPEDWLHVEKFPMSALPKREQPRNAPVPIGVNWYENFDVPAERRVGSQKSYWIGDRAQLGAVRGGHCVCLLPKGMPDVYAWWYFYNQGFQGACVGFGCSRMMSLLNRRRYDSWWLWNEAKEIDEWADTNPGDNNGTSVRAACDVLRVQGHVPLSGPWRNMVHNGEGIDANRWMTTVDEVHAALGTTGWNHVRILNSWGHDYPHITNMPNECLQRLLDEDGEAAAVTDR